MRVCVLLGLLSLVWSSCLADSYFVSYEGSLSSTDCSAASPCLSILQAINVFGTSSSSFDVYLASGVYSGNQNIGIALPAASSSFQPWTDYPGEIFFIGGGASSSSPCIQSGGNLTLSGITIQDCNKAVYSSKGSVSLSNIMITGSQMSTVTALNVTFSDRLELNNCVIQSGAVYGNASEVIVSDSNFASNNTILLISNTQTLNNNTFFGLKSVTLYANESVTLSHSQFHFNRYMATSGSYAVIVSNAPIGFAVQYAQKIEIYNVTVATNVTSTFLGGVGLYALNTTANNLDIAGGFYKGVNFQGNSAIATNCYMLLPKGYNGIVFQTNYAYLDAFAVNTSSSSSQGVYFFNSLSSSPGYALIQNGVVYHGQVYFSSKLSSSKNIIRNVSMIAGSSLHVGVGTSEISNVVVSPSASNNYGLYVTATYSYSYANVTVTDSTFSNLNYSFPVVYLTTISTSYGHITLKNCTFNDNIAIPSWLGVSSSLFQGANITIIDCTFVRNSALTGPTPKNLFQFLKGSTENRIENSYFEDNASPLALLTSFNDLVISNCSFVNHNRQVAPLIQGYGVTTITNSLIQNTGSFSLQPAGLIQLVNSSQVTGTVFSNNIGSLLWMYGGQITGCTFTNNTYTSTTLFGAALSIWSNTTSTTVSNCKFSDNYASTGAGIYVGEGYGMVTIENSDFDSNAATIDGSAIYVSDLNGGPVNISSSTFENNSGSSIFLATQANITTLTFTNYSTYAISCVNNVDVYYSTGTINIDGSTDNSQGIDESCNLIQGFIIIQAPSTSSTITPTSSRTPTRSWSNTHQTPSLSRTPTRSRFQSYSSTPLTTHYPSGTVAPTSSATTVDTPPSIWIASALGLASLVGFAAVIGGAALAYYLYKNNLSRVKVSGPDVPLLVQEEEAEE